MPAARLDTETEAAKIRISNGLLAVPAIFSNANDTEVVNRRYILNLQQISMFTWKF